MGSPWKQRPGLGSGIGGNMQIYGGGKPNGIKSMNQYPVRPMTAGGSRHASSMRPKTPTPNNHIHNMHNNNRNIKSNGMMQGNNDDDDDDDDLELEDILGNEENMNDVDVDDDDLEDGEEEEQVDYTALQRIADGVERMVQSWTNEKSGRASVYAKAYDSLLAAASRGKANNEDVEQQMATNDMVDVGNSNHENHVDQSNIQNHNINPTNNMQVDIPLVVTPSLSGLRNLQSPAEPDDSEHATPFSPTSSHQSEVIHHHHHHHVKPNHLIEESHRHHHQHLSSHHGNPSHHHHLQTLPVHQQPITSQYNHHSSAFRLSDHHPNISDQDHHDLLDHVTNVPPLALSFLNNTNTNTNTTNNNNNINHNHNHNHNHTHNHNQNFLHNNNTNNNNNVTIAPSTCNPVNDHHHHHHHHLHHHQQRMVPSQLKSIYNPHNNSLKVTHHHQQQHQQQHQQRNNQLYLHKDDVNPIGKSIIRSTSPTIKLGALVPNNHSSIEGHDKKIDEKYEAKVKELEISLLECATEYEVQIVEMKMKMLQMKSEFRQKGSPDDKVSFTKTLPPTLPNALQVLRPITNCTPEPLEPTIDPPPKRRNKDKQLDVVPLSKQKTRPSLETSQKRSNQEFPPSTLSGLQKLLSKREQELHNSKIREKELATQIQELQTTIQRGRVAQMEPKKLLSLLLALNEWLQYVKAGVNDDPFMSKKAFQNVPTLANLRTNMEEQITYRSSQSPRSDNLTSIVNKEIKTLQDILGKLSPPKPKRAN